jgi:hypothetical protein
VSRVHLQITGLSKRYAGGVQALDRVSRTIARGMYGLLLDHFAVLKGVTDRRQRRALVHHDALLRGHRLHRPGARRSPPLHLQRHRITAGENRIVSSSTRRRCALASIRT